jgi:hypothetical protein
MSSTCQPSRTWRELHVSALFETDTQIVQERIAEAERALIVRTRELFHANGDKLEEGEALQRAMYALDALRTAYQCGVGEGKAVGSDRSPEL